MSEDDEVLAANMAFYAAFRDGDLVSMADLWAGGTDVACIHPGWPPLHGRSRVLQSWHAILTSESIPAVRCREAVPYVLGDAAMVVCREVIDETHLVATNVFVREGGEWRIVHHHAGPVAGSAPAVSPKPLTDDFH